MMETDLHNSQRRIEKEKENISVFRNGKMAVSFLEAMITYGISVSRVSTLAWNVKTIISWKDDKSFGTILSNGTPNESVL